MATLDMNGDYDLINDRINKHISVNKIGNYALGYLKDKTFLVPTLCVGMHKQKTDSQISYC